MKKLLLLLLFVPFGLVAQDAGIKFEQGDFASIMAKAKAENKLIFMDAFAEWCGPCKRMAADVFPLPEVGEYFNANFVNAKIDMEKGEGKELAKKYNVRAYPTLLFIDGDGNLVHTAVGGRNAEQLIQLGKDANDPAKQTATMVRKFEAGDREPELLKNIIMAFAYSDPNLSQNAAKAYFTREGFTFTNDDLNLLMSMLNSSNSELYPIYVNNKAQIEGSIGADRYQQINTYLISNAAAEKAVSRENKSIDDAAFLAEMQKHVSEAEAQKSLAGLKLNLYPRWGQFDLYEKTALEYFRDPAEFNAQVLNQAAWTFFENVTNPESLKVALTWAEEAVKKGENYATLDTLANLCNKTGNKEMARLYAEKAVIMAKEAGEDATETQKLLDSLK